MVPLQLETLVLALVHVSLASSLVVAAGHALGLHGFERRIAWLGTLAFAVAAGIVFWETVNGGILQFYSGHVVHDAFTGIILAGVAVAGVLALAAAGEKPDSWPSSPGYYGLLPLILYGAFHLAGSSTPAMLLASWMLVSVATYVAVALPGEASSRIAATRYIYLGTIATLLLALWVVVVYSGSFLIGPAGAAIAFVGVLASLGFKTGVFPFHWWLPSVYARADGLVVSLVAGAAKAAFVAVLAKALIGLAASQPPQTAQALALGLAVLAVATMTYGNIAALTTRDLRSMLAYSSIAQTGYILVGLAALSYFMASGGPIGLALAGVALQAAAYAIAKAPLFALAGETGRPRLGGATAASTAVLLASLLGIPVLLGFWGKFYLFLPAAQYSLALVAVALINSAVSSAYYVRFLRDALQGDEKPSRGVAASLVAAAVITVLAGLAAPLLASALA